MNVDLPRGAIYQFPVARRNVVAATEERGATPVDPAGGGGEPVKESQRGFLQAARRNLTEDEAASPAGVRWLAHDVERLDQDCAALRIDLRDIRQRYDLLKDQHGEQRVELERLRGSATIAGRNEYLSYLCLSAGSAGIGATPNYFTVPGATTLAVIGTVISGVLIVGGLLLRKWK